MAWERSTLAAADESTARVSDLSSNVVAFCAQLRAEYHFSVGHAEAHDSLRALDALGVDDERRVRCALKLICCRTREQTIVFDRAFDAFFRPPPSGTAQPASVPRHTRPGSPKSAAQETPRSAERPPTPPDDGGFGTGQARERRPGDDEPDAAKAWRMLRARYSPGAAAAGPLPVLRTADDADLRALANRVVAEVRLGRSRRWRSAERGRRFDLRRTLRTNLQTGGDPVELRFLGHPRRNPRFVVLIDGSRSMSDQTAAIVGFARALCERTARAHTFFFSTELLNVTRAFRAKTAAPASLRNLGHAWGGGTRIGANLEAFIVRHGQQLLSPETIVIIFSDGLDAGDIPQLERAMRTIDRRSAGIVWLNPHAASPGFAPTARAMRAALPFVSLLTAANDIAALAKLTDQLIQNPALRRSRR